MSVILVDKEKLLSLVAHYNALTYAYTDYAKRHSSISPKAKVDPFYTTRIKDFEKCVDEARGLLGL